MNNDNRSEFMKKLSNQMQNIDEENSYNSNSSNESEKENNNDKDEDNKNQNSNIENSNLSNIKNGKKEKQGIFKLYNFIN
jgi:hypothetical protein